MDARSNFDDELNLLISPLAKHFSLNTTTEVKCEERDGNGVKEVEQGSSSGQLEKSPDVAHPREGECTDALSQWQSDVQWTLRTGHDSIQALTIIQKSFSSLFDTLNAVQQEYQYRGPSGALSGTSSKDVGITALSGERGGQARTSLKEDPSKGLSTCLSLLDRIVKDLDNPAIMVGSPHFFALAEELREVASTLQAFHVPVSVKDLNYRKAFFAFDKLHNLLRDAVQGAIQECRKGVDSSSALQDAARQLMPLVGKRDTEVLASSSQVATHMETWRWALSSINEVFLSKMEPHASLCRLLEVVGKNLAEYSVENASLRASREQSLTSLFDVYIRTRVHFLTAMLRWWLRHSESPDEKTSLVGLEKSRRTSPVSPTEDKTNVPPADASSIAVLPSFVEELALVLEVFSELEKEVVDKVWLTDEIALGILSQMSFTVIEDVYSTFRSKLLKVDDVAELAMTVEQLEGVRSYCSKKKWVKFSDLWVRMIQDTQERLIFRTSTYLKQNIASLTPSVEWADKYRSVMETIMGQEETTSSLAAAPLFEYFPSFPLTVELLKALHRTLTSKIFSVLAEEAIRQCLTQVAQLGRVMRSMKPPCDEVLVLLTELAHLHFLHHHLASLDANMTVVEKKLDFAQSLRSRKIRIIESSRESMQSVENQFATCYQTLVETMKKRVSSTGSGEALKNGAESAEEVKKMITSFEQLLLYFIPDQWLRAKVLLPVYQLVESCKT